MLTNRFPVEQLRPAFVQFQKDKPINLNSSHRAHREHRERNGISLFCRVTQKVMRNLVITVCFSSVISVFSVANYVFKDKSCICFQ